MQTNTTERMPATNSTFAIGGVSCSADTFVQAESSVLRINICGKNRQLLVAAKRTSGCEKLKMKVLRIA
jgi:hypothetical protein